MVTPPPPRPLSDCALRASAQFSLTLVDRLTAAERERLAPLRRDPLFYGVIRDGRGTTELAATRDIALLFLTLANTPGPLPEFAAAVGSEAWTAVRKLVLDGVLEIDAGDGFVSGAAAVALFGDDTATSGRLGRLARRALEFTAAMAPTRVDDAESLLYRFNRAPATPDSSRALSNPASVRAFLSLDHGVVASRLAAGWNSTTAGRHEGWIRFTHRGGARVRSARGATYKVYLSPVVADLPSALAAALPVFEEARVASFKIGASAAGLARADKMVCYFARQAEALECGEMLAEALHGLRPQGVPFTAEIGGDGLVSWGMDQPDPREHGAQVSWRSWICRRLGKYLVSVGSSPEGAVGAARFALERLRLDGVDVQRWAPAAELSP